MIRFLRGKLLFKDLKSACVDTGGVGYLVHMTMTELATLGAPDDQVELHIYTHVREGALELFAFAEPRSLSLFELLITTNGVGPKSALGILSGMDNEELIAAVMEGDEKRLLKAPGIGKKTAARIVLELQDRLARSGLADAQGTSVHERPPNTANDLESALLNLGYRPAHVEKAINSVKTDIESGVGLSDLVREALKHV